MKKQSPIQGNQEIFLSHRFLPDSPENEALLSNAHPSRWKNIKPEGIYDLVVLGGGPAGLTSATLAASQGKKVALVEEALLGGECFNIGCIPSKSIIRTSRLYADMKNAENFGGKVPKDIDMSFERVMMRMQQIRAQISEHLSAEQLQKRGIDVYFGHAEFSGLGSVNVNGCNLKFKKCLIATGSRPLIPDIPGLQDVDYLTNETIFNLKSLPESLLVIGGGSIGCELAQAFCRLGSVVTITQTEPMFLENVERDGAQILCEALAEDGISIHLNSVVLKIQKVDGKKIIDIINTGNKTRITATDILIGIGQTPNTQNLNLKMAGINTNEQGAIVVDKHFSTTNRHIFAVGTACDALDLNHIPVAAASVATQNALSRRSNQTKGTTTPWCIYTDPEIAHIGLQVAEARALKIPVKTFTVLMHQVDRAVADSEDRGFVKIHVKEGTDEILGATIVSRHAGDIMNGISLAMGTGIGLKQFAKIHYPYPTQGDAIKKAAIACQNSFPTPMLDRMAFILSKMRP